MKTQSIQLKDLPEMSDDECDRLSKEGYSFSLSFIKKLYIAYKTEKDTNRELSEFVDIIQKGQFKAYYIKCPNCGIEYTIAPEILNYNHQIQCLDCGFYYKQNENITGIVGYKT